MDDRGLMEDLLSNVKGACDLYLHGTIESSTPNVRCAFDQALDDCLKMQNDIYSKMSAKGWYTPDQAEQKQLDKIKQKFSMSM